jgi:predicted MFS family arabinose efflux permease
LARRIPVGAGLRACCWLCFAGNVLFAASPVFVGLAAGRVLTGLGLGLCFLFGGAFAQAAGGVRMLGVFGAGITLGIASALGLGSALEDVGVDWRWGFVISAAIGLLPLPFLPRHVETPPRPEEPTQGLLREAYSKLSFWRLQLLGISVLTVPLVIGAWLVQYLVSFGGLTTALAGALSFALFGLSATVRDIGGRLSAAGVPPGMLACAALLVGSAGIAILAVDASLGPAIASVLLQAIGLNLPYALFYDEGEAVLPDRPLAGLGLLQVGANSFPIPAVPLVGAALASGDEELAFLALAALVALAGIVNLRPAASGKRAG